MDQNNFRAKLVSDGYTQIQTNKLEPKPVNGDHIHDHDIRGLVLHGKFIVWIDNQPVSYNSGEVFMVSAGTKHAEQVGPHGAQVVIGRKWAGHKTE